MSALCNDEKISSLSEYQRKWLSILCGMGIWSTEISDAIDVPRDVVRLWVDHNPIEKVKLSNAGRVSRRYQRLKHLAVAYKGGECVRCGYDTHACGLQFHHLDPAEKDPSIIYGGTPSWSRFKEEVDKCILVCVNCHREIHEDIANEGLREKDDSRLCKSRLCSNQVPSRRRKYCSSKCRTIWYSRTRRRRRKSRCVEYKGGECEVCGYNKCHSAMEFHHRDPTSKLFGIGDVSVIQWEKVREELDKCTLLCSRCHIETHSL